MRREKLCPVCNKTEWNYDVYNGLHSFCGDCHHAFRQEAYKINPVFNLGDGEGLTMREYRQAIKLAMKTREAQS